MTQVSPMSNDARERWQLRSVPDSLVQHYVEQGWWTDDSLGDLVARGLAVM